MGIGEKNNKEIAKRLSQATGFNWSGDEDGVYCGATLNAADKMLAEAIFKKNLQTNGIPIPTNILHSQSKLRRENSTLLPLLQIIQSF
ncbi:hypothetical protein [Legionella cardiaca]|uniref:Uncharacterized protein n=1 Tax=Legionella cardiaca TaxID=1071983 RepID=A0ABY8AUN2_9GAMM|nr:hypothetical protein [Legionella cardiaca]WED43101.1 hypothetical protein PXX05_14560 [Legionella cardiaca]